MLFCYSILVVSIVFLDESQASSLQNVCGSGSFECDNSIYRRIDGSCNNLKNPRWGSSESEYGRLLPAKFGDGVHSFPTSKTGRPLPNARNASYHLYPDAEYQLNYTLGSMQYGQIITHDLSFTHLSGSLIGCCTDYMHDLDETDLDCHSIDVTNQPYYRDINATCMSFIRTDTNVKLNCSLDKKPEQLSLVTSYLDMHLIYGYQSQVNDYVRAFEGGLLATVEREGQEWFQNSTDVDGDCFAVHVGICYGSGDARLVQNTHLTLLHVIWLREHNRIARALSTINPHWDDEKIFQETRKIVIAQHQHISYYELLPIYVGKKVLYDEKILYDTDGFINDYNASVNPAVANEFSHGAFRVFHSMIEPQLQLLNEDRSLSRIVHIKDWYNNPIILEKDGNFDKLARGLHTQKVRTVDKFHTDEITLSLFVRHLKYGMDLKSWDIQRNRDHGLASYNDAREFCKLKRADTFEDFLDVIEPDSVKKLTELYEHIDDIDMVVGMSLEKPASEALVGPTALCVIIKQFYRTRVADRLWYENNETNQFTLEQLREIRKASISKKICDNAENISLMQPRGFHLISEDNPLTPCTLLPNINLYLWADGQTAEFKEQHPKSFLKIIWQKIFSLF